MPQQSIVIIGSGIAGLSAAEAARRQDPQCLVTLLSDDSHLPYYRQRLCEVLGGPARADQLLIHPQEWYAQQGFDLQTNAVVDAIRTDRKTVVLRDGRAFAYTSLILASGSASFVPPLQGAGLPGVETLWTLADTLRIEARVKDARRAIVIGGGLLGLEAAYALHQRGLSCLILERLPRLMMRQLDERSAQIFTAQVEREGTQVATGAIISEIYAGPDGRAAGVRLEDGSAFPADLIILSAGVRPRLEYLSGSGIETDKYITVDSRMRTNVPGVYAAGDCAIQDRRWYGLWPIARQQGLAAGGNAAGGDREYQMPVPPFLLKTMGTQIASAGLVEENNLPREALERLRRDIEDKAELFQYAKKLYVGGALSGFILLGDTKAFTALNRELGQESA